MKQISVKKLLPLLVFFVIFLGFSSAAKAANFACVQSTITTTSAKLTIDGVGSVYDIDDDSVYLAPAAAASSTAIGPTEQTDGSKDDEQVYEFDSLAVGTPYRVIVVDGNGNFIEEITSCDFTTQLSGASTTQSTSVASPAITTTTPAGTPVGTSVPVLTPTAAVSTTGLGNTGSIVSPDGDGLIPCDGDDCTVTSVIQLLDNLMNFFFQTLLLPIVVVMIMYLGFSYLNAQGKPGQHAKVLSMAKHLVLGLILMLCAWLIVHTILSVLGYNDPFGFFGS